MWTQLLSQIQRWLPDGMRETSKQVGSGVHGQRSYLPSMLSFEHGRNCLSSKHRPMKNAGCIMQLEELLLCMFCRPWLPCWWLSVCPLPAAFMCSTSYVPGTIRYPLCRSRPLLGCKHQLVCNKEGEIEERGHKRKFCLKPTKGKSAHHVDRKTSCSGLPWQDMMGVKLRPTVADLNGLAWSRLQLF